MNRRHVTLGLLLALPALQGCGADASPAPSATDPCQRGTLEADFMGSPLAGPGVTNGVLAPGRYVFSSTYLRLRPEPAAQMRFGQFMGPISADLRTRAGLVAYSAGTSASCGTARTLTVWRDEMAMYDFVSSPAHGAAVMGVAEVSRGGSVVTHWSGAATEATWAAGARQVAAITGPTY
jgi:hypothetical protein